MKNPSIQLALSTLGVIAILAVGLFTVQCVPPAPCGNITVNLNPSSRLVSETDVAAGGTFEITVPIDIQKEFKERYAVPLEDLKEFYVSLAQASFTSDRCSDLSSYEISVSFPGYPAVTAMNPCDFSEFASAPDPAGLGNIVLYFSNDFPGPNPTAKQILTTNFAGDIKDGKIVSVTVKFKALNNIPAGFGVTMYMESNVTYGKCE